MSYNVFPQLSGITWNIKKRPTWNTTKMLTAGGNEFRTGYRQNPITEFDLSYSYLSPTDMLSMEGFFNGQNGALTPFYFDLGVATNDASDNSVTAYQFGTGDGATTAFTLLKPAGTGASEPIGGVNGSPLIYKSDWQGNQLQYSTPRTNYSPPITSSMLNNSGNTLTTGVTAPDGSTNAITVSGMGSTTPYSGININTFTAEQTGNVQVGVWAKGNGTVHLLDENNNYYQQLNLTSTWTLFTVNANIVNPSQSAMRVLNVNGVDTATTMSLYAPMFVPGAILGSYIPTTTSAVTVTDYTLTGNLVTFAVAPLLNAALTWTGNFYYLVRFSEDVIEFNQLANQMYELQECKLVSVQ